jgi:hypothetical protein
MTTFQARVKSYIMDQAPVCADAIICKKTGEVEVKRGYFYTFGNTAEKWADSVADSLKTVGIPAIVTHRNDFANWPKTSYFVAVVKEAQPC